MRGSRLQYRSNAEARMTDESLLGDPAAAQLSYVEATPPEAGKQVRIAEGVHWIRMPLPIELDHINLWLIEHERGFVLIDTGLACDLTRATWESLERETLRHLPLRLIMLTHLHPDHAGLAAWLQDRHGVPVWASRQTESQMRALLTPLTPSQLAERTQFFVGHGVEDAAEIRTVLLGERYRSVVSGLPQVEHRPQDTDEVLWGQSVWRFLDTPGHASGHLCLHAAASGVLICGDQLLPTISPNVSLTAWSADANPLASYLASLERLSQLPGQTLVLPSHGRPFYGLRARARELGAHHRAQLARLLAACVEPSTAHQSLRVLFRRTLRGFHQFLALGEAIAHLEYLAAEGSLARTIDAQGVVRFGRV
jgi:glyoxylase-like metal-dependent hydrolase (beta-lactamase superfamily II)